MLPVCPDSVKTVLLVPEQTVAEPAMLPPTLTGSTVTLPVMLPDTQLVVVFLSVKVNEMELPEAAVLKVTLMGLVKSPSVTPVIPAPEIE